MKGHINLLYLQYYLTMFRINWKN